MNCRAILSASLLFALPAALPAQEKLPLVDDVDWEGLHSNCLQLTEALAKLKAGLPAEVEKELRALLREKPADPALAAAKVQGLLDPYCLVGVTINPQSRVKAVRGPAAAELRKDQEGVLLLKLHNDAGVTHALAVASPQERTADGGGWINFKLNDAAPLPGTLGGQRLEYLLLRIRAREAGKREATLTFDVGQGTQDLGFRAEVPILFTVRP